MVSVRTAGVLTIADVRRFAVEAFAQAVPMGTTRFLVDHRASRPEASTLDIYGLPEELRAIGLPLGARVATVLAPGMPGRKEFDFFENVALNRGFAMRNFDDVDSAVAWLRGV